MSALTSFALVAERPRPKTASRAQDLAAVAAELNRLYAAAGTAAAFRATSGDYLEGALAPGADPMAALLLATLAAGPDLHWTIVGGGNPGRDAQSGRAQSGEQTRQSRRAVVRTGSPKEDGLLEDLLPVLFDQLDELTERQRTVVRLALVDGLRQSQVAARLGVKRATVSISFERSHIASLSRFVSALRRLMLRQGGELDAGSETSAG